MLPFACGRFARRVSRGCPAASAGDACRRDSASRSLASHQYPPAVLPVSVGAACRVEVVDPLARAAKVLGRLGDGEIRRRVCWEGVGDDPLHPGGQGRGEGIKVDVDADRFDVHRVLRLEAIWQATWSASTDPGASCRHRRDELDDLVEEGVERDAFEVERRREVEAHGASSPCADLSASARDPCRRGLFVALGRGESDHEGELTCHDISPTRGELDVSLEPTCPAPPVSPGGAGDRFARTYPGIRGGYVGHVVVALPERPHEAAHSAWPTRLSSMNSVRDQAFDRAMARTRSGRGRPG